MYIVEGNIGAGKSTFLKMLKDSGVPYMIAPEPVHNWASERYGQSLLEEFYKRPGRWAFTLETFAMISRSLDHVKYQKDISSPVVMERSIYSGHYCFALNGHSEGFFNDTEWAVYEQWVNFILNYQCKPPRGFIYLRATPEKCYERIHKRKRAGEESVSLGYLKNIHDRHEQFLITKETLEPRLKNIPVLTLDTNAEFENNEMASAMLLAKTESFIAAQQNMSAIL